MSEIPKENFINYIEQAPREAMPMTSALFLIDHIKNPCQTEVSSGVFRDIRAFYLAEAGRQLQKIKTENPHAAQILEGTINQYKGK